MKKIQRLYIVLTIITFFYPYISSSQLVNNVKAENLVTADSLNAVLPLDSTNIDSIQTDSTQNPKQAQLEGPIKYSADIVQVGKDKNRIYLDGNAKVVYQNMTLDAAKILINQEDRTLYAEGKSDTTDSLGKPIYTGIPVFTERGREPMTGNTLLYNFETKRGKISYGKTKMPPGYYKGENVYKISQNTLLVEDGYFTSCEYIDEPHFFFFFYKMRI